MYYKQETGKEGEDIAVYYLKSIGYNVIERNFECRQGEIDIIALDKDEIVFIEVKTRRNKKYGLPAEAVNDTKKKHLWKAVQYYLYSRNLQDDFIRLDVIEMYLSKGKTYINHIKKAIE